MALATEHPIIPLTNGGADITQGKVVKLSSGATIATTAVTDTAFGVVTEDAEAGEQVSVVPAGCGAIVYVEAAASGIAVGDSLAPAASGRAAKTTTAGQKSFGTALEASTAAGELIKCVLAPSHRIMP